MTQRDAKIDITDAKLASWLEELTTYANRGFEVEIDTATWGSVLKAIVDARQRIAELETKLASIDVDLEDAG